MIVSNLFNAFCNSLLIKLTTFQQNKTLSRKMSSQQEKFATELLLNLFMMIFMNACHTFVTRVKYKPRELNLLSLVLYDRFLIRVLSPLLK